MRELVGSRPAIAIYPCIIKGAVISHSLRVSAGSFYSRPLKDKPNAGLSVSSEWPREDSNTLMLHNLIARISADLHGAEFTVRRQISNPCIYACKLEEYFFSSVALFNLLFINRVFKIFGRKGKLNSKRNNARWRQRQDRDKKWPNSSQEPWNRPTLSFVPPPKIGMWKHSHPLYANVLELEQSDNSMFYSFILTLDNIYKTHNPLNK